MANNRYNKKDLERFRKEIQKRVDELNGTMDGIRDDLNINSKGMLVLLKILFTAYTWQTQARTHMSAKKVFI